MVVVDENTDELLLTEFDDILLLDSVVIKVDNVTEELGTVLFPIDDGIVVL